MTSAQPEETRGHGPQDSPSFKPGVEICSSNFVVRLFSGREDERVYFTIYYLRANGTRDGLQSASSEWLTELVDNLNLVEIQIKRDGVESKPQVLGRRVGVGISSRHYEKDTETFVAELPIAGDGRNWNNRFGGSFDVSLIPELRQLTSEVLDLIRKEAIPEQKGLGFKFKAT